MDVVVTGIGLISVLGSLEQSWYKLLQGESGIKSHQPFPDLPSRPLALIGETVASLESLTKWVVADAIRDAGLTLPLPDCGVVIGSSRGCQASWEQLANRHVDYSRTSLSSQSPITHHPPPITLNHWLDTLPHQGAIAAAREIGSQQPVLAPMAACATGIWAIHRGFELIQTGQCQRVIAGAVEAPITPLTLAGFDQIGALAQTGAYPFDRNREGLVLGEGAAVLVLESADLALERGASIYGEVLGFGLTCDAHHVCAPDPSGRSAVTAINQCLERSQLSPIDIDYIHTHGTGTHLNDENEAQLIQYLFSHGVPVSSTKGATGHTLGSSGAISAAFCLMAFKHQVLIPCVGLRESEFDLDLVKVSRQCEVERSLCFSFGFGGQNAVMALGTFTT